MCTQLGRMKYQLHAPPPGLKVKWIGCTQEGKLKLKDNYHAQNNSFEW